jgi:hypothetical protein
VIGADPVALESSRALNLGAHQPLLRDDKPATYNEKPELYVKL